MLKAKKKGHPCLRLFLRARQLFARVLHYVSLPWWILFDRLILRALVRGACSKFQRNKRVWTTNRVIGCSRFSRVWVNRSRNLAMITSLPRLRDHKVNVGDIVPRLAADRRKKVRYIVPCWEECQALGLGMKYTCKSPLQNASGSWLNHLLKVRQQTRERVRRYIIGAMKENVVCKSPNSDLSGVALVNHYLWFWNNNSKGGIRTVLIVIKWRNVKWFPCLHSLM